MDASARGVRWEGVLPQMRPGDAADGEEGGRVGMWNEVGGRFAANAAGGNAGDDGEGGRVGMRKGVQGWFSANAAGERMPGEDTDRMPGGGRKQGAGSREPEARNRSREQEQGTGAGKRGGVGFFKAVSGFFTILAGWNEIIIQTIWLKR